MNPPTDKNLVAAALSGDAEAWTGLVHRHYGLVFGIGLAWLGDVEAAEDLAQEVFLRLFLQLKDLRDGSRFAPWAARAARNLAANWKRDRQTRSRLLPMIAAEEATMAEVPDSRPTARDQAAREEQQRLVRDLIATLPEEERELVVLHFMEGCSQRELARRLGVNVSTVSRRLDASLKRLRERFEDTATAALRPDEGTRARAAAKAGAFAAAYMALPESGKAAVATSRAFADGASAVVEASKVVLPVGVAATTASFLTGVTLMSAKSIAISAAIAAAIVLLVVGGVVVTNLPKQAGRPEAVAQRVDERPANGAETDRERAATTPRVELAQSEPVTEATAEESGTVTAEAAREAEEVVESFDGIALVVRGRVLNERGRPIEGAEVRLSKVDMRALTGYMGGGHPVVIREDVEATAISEANGTYELRSRRGFPLQLAALAPGHRIETEGITHQTINLRPLTSETQLLERDFMLPAASALQGRVVDEADEPVGGAKVKAVYVSNATWNLRAHLEVTTETDSQGEFVLEGLGQQRVRMDVEKDGMGKVRHVVEHPHTGEVVIRLSRHAQSVSGVVTDWEGEPVSGATVAIGNNVSPNMMNSEPVWFEVTSEDDGQFVFESVPEDSYMITARSSDGRRVLTRDNRSYEPVNVVAGINVEGLNLRLFDGYTVRGTVRDAANGSPVVAANVTAMNMSEEDQRSTASDDKGEYVLTGVQGISDPGHGTSIYMRANRDGFRFVSPNSDSRPHPQIMAEPGQREYILDLEMAATVEWSGRVVKPDGQPAAGATVASVGEEGARATADGRGEFTLQVAVNRRAQVLATLSGYPPTHSEPVDIETEAPSDVVIRLDPGATAVLRVEDQEGKAISDANAWLMIRTYGGTWSGASRSDIKTTGFDGRAVFEQLPTEGYPISILHNKESNDFFARMKGYGTPEEAGGETFRPGERREIVIIMPSLDESGVIAGLVTDPDGRPLANVQMQLNKAPENFQATTGSDGRFRKDKLPAGRYNLILNHVEHGYAFEHFVETGREDLTIVMGKDNVMVTILLVDDQTGQPVKGARVMNNQRVGLTDIPGAHRFPNYNRNRAGGFVVTAPGYEDLTIPAPSIPEGQRDHIMTAEMTPLAE